jgi:hypothetical protein
MTDGNKVRWFRRCAVIPIALVIGLGLAGCGRSQSVSPPTTLTAPSRSVAEFCRVVSRVDRLVVIRRAPANQFHFTFPAVVTVTSAVTARAVAVSACALPDAPKSAQACPAEFDLSYRLFFAVRGENGLGGEAIAVNPTGCQWVTGLGTVREALYHVAFYRILGTAMGLRNASYMTFRGA